MIRGSRTRLQVGFAGVGPGPGMRGIVAPAAGACMFSQRLALFAASSSTTNTSLLVRWMEALKGGGQLLLSRDVGHLSVLFLDPHTALHCW